MSWLLVLPHEAEKEIREAENWYDQQQEGLGRLFRIEILKVLRSVERNPLLNSERDARRHLRWRMTKRFPYLVIYALDVPRKRVVVAAILHAAREEQSGRRRTGEK